MTGTCRYHTFTASDHFDNNEFTGVDMDPSPARRLRWSIYGALVLAILAMILGGAFTVIIGLFTGQLTPEAPWQQWLAVLFPAVLIWGGGALPFGAALGFFASHIWRDV